MLKTLCSGRLPSQGRLGGVGKRRKLEDRRRKNEKFLAESADENADAAEE